MVTFQQALTTNRTHLTTNYYQFEFESKSENFSFLPGQYITLKVADLRINHYSIASAPIQNHFQLLIDTTPGGPGSQYAEKLQVGDTIEYLGPFGNFVLHPDDQSQEVYFLATGSGIAPFKSMIDHLLIGQKDTRPIHLYFGLRYVDDIIFKDHFQKLERDYPNFHCRFCISKPHETWAGVSGYVTHAAHQNIRNGANISAYLCGSQQMINDATSILTSLGTPTDKIYTEKFW